MTDPDVERLQVLASLLLDDATPASSLRPEVVELSILVGARKEDAGRDDRDISEGETLTANGLALSPRMAAMCLDDYVRTIVFLRGIHAAISDLSATIADRPVRVLYAGCGPFAALALPLMSFLPSGSAVFTLMDIHAESIRSAQTLIERFGLAHAVDDYLIDNAMDYRAEKAALPDLVILEVMQACLESEPQVAIARHLLAEAPGAVLVPETISIRFDLIDLAQEFSISNPQSDQPNPQRDRLSLGEVFRVDRRSLQSWCQAGNETLSGATIELPSDWEGRYQPMVVTEITTYQDHLLTDYDSGLTCPRSPTLDGSLEPGGLIEFVYELGHHPRLVGYPRKARPAT